MQIPLDSIRIPERVRKDLGDLGPLMDSLKQLGQLNPITVSPSHELITGHRRLSAAQRLGWKSIDAVVVNGLDEIRCLEMELAENLYRKDFTPDEVLEGWKRLDALRHPKFMTRVRNTVMKFFHKLAFWRRPQAGSKKPTELSVSPHGVPGKKSKEAMDEIDIDSLHI